MLLPLLPLAMIMPPKISIETSRLKATVEHLASYNTRNTSSPELEVAAKWVADQFRAIPGMKVELMTYPILKGPRVPEDRTVVQVIATLPGISPDRIVLGGHLDSINLRADPLTGRAPGANDDASGVALTLEVARVMAAKSWEKTLTFVAFSGEEEGLFGSTALAKRAKAEGWSIDGVLSCDMVGNSTDNLGQKDADRVRVFSAESRDHQSRELARYIEWLAATRREDDRPYFDATSDQSRQKRAPHGVKLVFRQDRFGRGGDHSPFNTEGFTAVRFVDVFEEYTRQHTPNDLPQAMDFAYLTKNAKLVLYSMSALAGAGVPPSQVTVKRDQSQDTTLEWKGASGQIFVIYWRDTASPVWEHETRIMATSITIPKVNKDDHVFAVGAVGGIPVLAR